MNDEDENQEVEDLENQLKPCNSTCENSDIWCYRLLVKNNLYSNAYSLLTVAYKYRLTLPVTQVSCERYFSTLKYIRNRASNEHQDLLC